MSEDEPTDEEIREALDELVRVGDVEVISGTEDDPRYRLTDQGEAKTRARHERARFERRREQ